MTLNCIIMLSQQLGRYVERIHSQDTPILAIIHELVGPSHEGVSPQGPLLPVDDYGRFRLPTTRDAPTAIERHLYDDVTTQMGLTLGSFNDYTSMFMLMFSFTMFLIFLCLPFIYYLPYDHTLRTDNFINIFMEKILNYPKLIQSRTIRIGRHVVRRIFVLSMSGL